MNLWAYGCECCAFFGDMRMRRRNSPFTCCIIASSVMTFTFIRNNRRTWIKCFGRLPRNSFMSSTPARNALGRLPYRRFSGSRWTLSGKRADRSNSRVFRLLPDGLRIGGNLQHGGGNRHRSCEGGPWIKGQGSRLATSVAVADDRFAVLLRLPMDWRSVGTVRHSGRQEVSPLESRLHSVAVPAPQVPLTSSPPKLSGQTQSKNADSLTNSIDL